MSGPLNGHTKTNVIGQQTNKRKNLVFHVREYLFCISVLLIMLIYNDSDLLTLFPENTLVSFAEKLIMPMLFFTIMLLLPMYFMDKKGFTKFSIGIGPFMLFRRTAYETVGTHEAVKSALVEDV